MLRKEKNKYQLVYPALRLVLSARRNAYIVYKNVLGAFVKRRECADSVPACYDVCNTTTHDGTFDLKLLFGETPNDLQGTLYICQCLGTKNAYMVGDTNLVKIDFESGAARLKNRLMWSPVAIARAALEKTKHRFEHFGVMQMAPGLGMFSYAEGVYVLPDGRLGITSDIDRPWIVDRKHLRIQSPLGTRKEWMPMMGGQKGDVMGSLFAGYNNSHALYTDPHTNEAFLVNYRCKQDDKSHPCKLMKWNGSGALQTWLVKGDDGLDICIRQSIHELVFTRDYILLADTAFVTGSEIMSQWKNAPLPSKNTAVYIVDRRTLCENVKSVVAKKIVIEQPCIHLLADYENPNHTLTVYMLHTPATNTAEVIRSYDRDLQGKRFPKQLVGFGTLPVLDVSSLGKHCLCMQTGTVKSSSYIRDKSFCWGPYMYAYMGRQVKPFHGQDLFVMFKGFHAELLPKRLYEAYRDAENRVVPLAELFQENGGISANNCLVRIKTNEFQIKDSYILPEKVHLYTIACLESAKKGNAGYVLAGVASDLPENSRSSGHEYWLFDANDLAKGPICKWGHEHLNNSILFHSLYLTKAQQAQLDEKTVQYKVSMHDDYPEEELTKWDASVLEIFKEMVWPYFGDEQAGRIHAEKKLRQLAKKRVPHHAGKESISTLFSKEATKEAADKMLFEAERMLSTTGWRMECQKQGVLVESKPAGGAFQKSGVNVCRASGLVCANADKLLASLAKMPELLLQTKNGTVISHGDCHDDKCIESIFQKSHIRATKQGDILQFGVYAQQQRLLVLKTVHPMAKPENTTEKTAMTHAHKACIFAVKTIPVTQNTCRVLCVHCVDKTKGTPAPLHHYLHLKTQFSPFYKRLRKQANRL